MQVHVSTGWDSARSSKDISDGSTLAALVGKREETPIADTSGVLRGKGSSGIRWIKWALHTKRVHTYLCMHALVVAVPGRWDACGQFQRALQRSSCLSGPSERSLWRLRALPVGWFAPLSGLTGHFTASHSV